ncbi:MAG TPA: pirin family protein [Steroidobacteraceae bacterium]|jgi:redox-sensitive bicupin YhaK (pirin superfamily)|nr:pirin family protein [Steroidobacteraceae bacterium]
MRQVVAVHDAAPPHWVGDGFPVRSVFSYDGLGRGALSPFLMLDYAAPRHFDPAPARRGVGVHPHRGFETVTLVYAGELEHRDSAGNGGRIGPGDVQWMTAASGILHEEFHSERFTREGGTMSMMQLWVNLPARAKLSKPRYQTILDETIPRVALGDAGTLRVVAGEYEGRKGPAETFTPMSVWDLRLAAGRSATLATPEGHTTAIVPMQGLARVNDSHRAGPAQLVRFAREGGAFKIEAEGDGELTALVLSGQPIGEPVVGYGPFVMNSEREIAEAFADFQSGRFGRM